MLISPTETCYRIFLFSFPGVSATYDATTDFPSTERSHHRCPIRATVSSPPTFQSAGDRTLMWYVTQCDERPLSFTHFSETRRHGVAPSFFRDLQIPHPFRGQLCSTAATTRHCPTKLPSATTTPYTISQHPSFRLFLPLLSE